jgi:hypothetical protein
MLTAAGWSVVTEIDLDTSQLQDAAWEIDMCLNWTVPEMVDLAIPPRHRTLLETQVAILSNLTDSAVSPLPAFAVTCLASNPPRAHAKPEKAELN